MNRRHFLRTTACQALAISAASALLPLPVPAVEDPATTTTGIDPDRARDWRARWEKSILGDSRNRYCDKEMGEEIGWLISPFLNAYYYGYRATGDEQWIVRFIDWADSLIRRAVKEPDGFLGWPKGDGGGGDSREYTADSLLGEAMVLRPMVLLADQILKTPALAAKWGESARGYLELANRTFTKWDSRGCWRPVKEGGLWIVARWGVDLQTGQWSAGYARKETGGFSNPANKQNHIARWLLAMSDATGKPVYRERAEKWFQLMKSRLKTRADGKYYVWNYWEPAGPWDYKSDGSPQHWVGVHPNGGYYQIDVEGMVGAFEHGLVFTRSDLDRLIATNRDFMWNRELKGARFQRIDGEPPDPRWKNSPGVLWTALVPYDDTLRKIFVENNDPTGWSGLSATPWFLALGATK